MMRESPIFAHTSVEREMERMVAQVPVTERSSVIVRRSSVVLAHAFFRAIGTDISCWEDCVVRACSKWVERVCATKEAR